MKNVTNLDGLGFVGKLVPSGSTVKEAVADTGAAILGFAGANVAWGYAARWIPEQVKIHEAVTPAIKVLVGIVAAPMVLKLGAKWAPRFARPYAGKFALGVSLGLVGTGLWGIAKAFGAPLPDGGFGAVDDGFGAVDDDAMLFEGAALAVEDEVPALAGAPMVVENGYDPMAAVG